MNYKENVISVLSRKPYLHSSLFIRGFLISTNNISENDYPFYGKWNLYSFGKYNFYIHPDQTLYFACNEDIIYFLIGHAYNPFTMEVTEQKILERIAMDKEDAVTILNQLTGVFTFGWITNESLAIFSDCAGMQTTYYGVVNNHLYISSHMQLIGDICDLEQTEYVKSLVSYRFYPFYGAYLPGDISSYDDIYRLVPNTKVTYCHQLFSVERFYPVIPLKMCQSSKEYEEKIAFISDILKNTLHLIAMKWDIPAISLTGGMDSKTTLSAANGIYDKFNYFSYISMPGEKIDADAAHKIANALNIPHHIDYIPDDSIYFSDYDDIALLLKHNFGNIGSNNPNDIRKRIYYADEINQRFDIEVKSWVSEIGRANYYKKFGLKKMPKRLTPRNMTSMYKLFINNRRLVSLTDKVFKNYIDKTHFYDMFNYDESDMFLWEIRYGSWGGQVITSEHKFSFDITVPYNNRILLECFLSLPLDKRISDQAHRDIINQLDPRIENTGITITNYNETKTRMIKEKLYFLIHSILPF